MANETKTEKTEIVPQSVTSKEEQVIRTSLANYDTRKDEAKTSNLAMKTGSPTQLFDEDGNLMDAEEVADRIAVSFDSIDHLPPEEQLKQLKPHLLGEINKLTDDGATSHQNLTKQELIQHHLKKAKEELIETDPEDVPTFTVTTVGERDHNDRYTDATDQEKWVPSVAEGYAQICCDGCGSTEVDSQGSQTGAADEGQTVLHICRECGHKWRTGYGGSGNVTKRMGDAYEDAAAPDENVSL